MPGRNRALLSEQQAISAKADKGAPACIFISHFCIDKEITRAITDYITDYAGLDVYFDENDAELQPDVLLKDPARVTKCIERGMLVSTHILSLVSSETCAAWWLPYQIGLGKTSSKGVAILKLKGQIGLPEYLNMSTVLRSTRSLNLYLEALRGTRSSVQMLNESLMEHKLMNHPLDNILDWQELT